MKKSLHLAAFTLLAFSGLSPNLSAAVQLPYTTTFGTSSTDWTLLDLNGDGDNWGAKKWALYSDGIRFNLVSSQNGAADDWAISPAFALEAGRQYEVKYLFYGNSSSAKNIPVDLKLVTSVTSPESDGTLIAHYPPAEGGTTNKNATPYTTTFTAPASGTYYIGAHMTASYVPYTSGGPAEQNGQIYFRSFSITPLQKAAAPGAVTSFAATPGAQGARTATLSFTAPANDAEGNALEGTVRINLYREDQETPFFTSDGMQPGTSSTATDNEPFEGETWYVARAANDSGEGADVRADVYVGEDTPTAVRELKTTVADGKVSLTWNVPEGGQHGQYLNTEGLRYNISRILDDEITPLGEVAASAYTDDTLSPDRQVNVSYQVTAVSSAGLGQASQTRPVNFGTPLTLPFADSFAAGKFQTSPWRQEVVFNFEGASYEPKWDIIEQTTVTDNVTDDNPEGDEITIASQDTDKGFLRFNSNAVGKMKDPAKGRLISPSVSLKGMKNPVLSFYMFRETYYTTDPATNGGYRDDHVVVETSVDNGVFTPVEDAEFHRYGTENDWVLCEVPLHAVTDNERVQIALLGSGFGGGPIYIDNVRIDDRIAYDLQALEISGPSRIRIGESGAFSVTVKNAGGFTADDYAVELMCEGESVASATFSGLKPGKTVKQVVEYAPASDTEIKSAEISARVVLQGDQVADNNATGDITVNITEGLLPAISSITATANSGEVTLTWPEPDSLGADALIEEDGFESYKPFAINDFGKFTSYDADNKVTYGIGQAAGITYPGSGEKIGFQIFTPSATEIDVDEQLLWTPRSGLNMAIAPQAQSMGSSTTSDDWLVFPPLSGNSQSIGFYARSVSEDYREYIKAYYTTTSTPTAPEDFIPCPHVGDISYAVPTEWTRLVYSVPQGAKFFALRHISADGYALMVDDATYERAFPTLEEAGFTGYNVYCDGVKANATPLTETTFTHTPGDGTHTYNVKAVYTAGESRGDTNSATVQVSGSGVDGIVGDNAGIQEEWYTLQGIRISSPAGPGIYIVKTGSRSRKVVVR